LAEINLLQNCSGGKLIKITLRNYRGFTSQSPASFILGDGFTAFVGKNNAGKSTCLRAIFELRSLFNNHAIWTAMDPGAQSIQCPTEPDPTILLNFDNTEDAFVTLEIDPPLLPRYQLVKSTLKIDRDGRVTLSAIQIANLAGNLELKPPIAFQGLEDIPPNDPNIVIRAPVEKYKYSYLEFFLALQNLSSCSYYGAYRNAINEGAGNYYDIAVGTALISQWDYWKAGANYLNQRAIARVEADIERLLGYKSVEINASADNKTLNVIVNKHPFKLADLGAGVAELIITLSNALVKRPSYILIDEPESHLHPSLQIDFLTTLASYTTEGIAFSTHSIGLARSIADRIYVVSRADNNSSCAIYEKQPHLAELLGSLSYTGYLPAENFYVLLVEGTTEVKTFQILLRKLKKDHLYAIISLGGSSLIRENSDIELGEVIRVAGGANKVFAIIDSEKHEPNALIDQNHSAFMTTCQKLKLKLLVTERRATENYFTDKAIKKALGNSYSALTHYEDRNKHENIWGKSENWRIADCEEESFFQDHDLGKFLAALPIN
jgi:energy-coupling factor transporter ATP-binding protein EcfA2